jgi:cell division protein FtsA
MMKERIITAIDVGTTKICVLVAQVGDDGSLNVIGFGQAPSAGLARGVVVTIAPVVAALHDALREATLSSGHTIETASVGISGGHIRSCNSHGMVMIKHGEIRDVDIEQVMKSAQSVPVPEGLQLLHAVPQFFMIDGHEMVKNPRNMFGVRLEVQAHLIMGAVSSVQNIVRCCELAGVKVSDVILEPIASAEAVLSHDERELGVGMLDIGGGTSDFAIYQRGTVRHTYIIPIAGNVFTNDIAVCLQTTIQDAERLKKEFGIADQHLLADNHTIDVAQMNGLDRTTLLRSDLVEVLQPRTRELLSIVAHEVERNQLRSLMPAGLVLTGGGSLLTGIQEQALDILHMPVRRGAPLITSSHASALHSPIYATGYGLLAYVARRSRESLVASDNNSFMNRLVSRMKSWVLDIF